jgi:hypothetical protein
MSDEEFRFSNGKLAYEQMIIALNAVVQNACGGNSENLRNTVLRLSEVMSKYIDIRVIVGYPHFEYMFTHGHHHIEVQVKIIMGYWRDTLAWEQMHTSIRASAMEGVYVHPTISPSVSSRESPEIREQLRPRRRQ